MRTEIEAAALELMRALARANLAEQANEMLLAENKSLKERIAELTKTPEKPEEKEPA